MDPVPHLVRRGEGPTMLFVHGNGVDHRLLLALDAVIAATGRWERIYLDLPGFGRTPPLGGRGGLQDLADWLVSAIDEIVPSQRFAVLASSLGGLLARNLAAERPDRVGALALLAPVVDPRRDRRDVPARSCLREDVDLLASLPHAHATAFREVAVEMTPQVWRRVATWALPGILAADDSAMARLAEQYTLRSDPESSGPVFEGPCLIVTGRQDHVVGHADQCQLLDHYRRATFAVLDGAGHNVHLDRPDEVSALVASWAYKAVAELSEHSFTPRRAASRS